MISKSFKISVGCEYNLIPTDIDVRLTENAGYRLTKSRSS